MAHAIQYRRLRAPREHGQSLIVPPLADALDLLASNVTLARSEYHRVMIGGMSLPDLRGQARHALLADAYRYSRSYWEGVRPPVTDAPIVLSGHQPELFHPGVWFKNFVLSAIGERAGANTINLVIDNDTVVAPTVRVLRSREYVETVPLDAAADELPYEERAILDPALLATFAARVDRPLARHLWEYVALLHTDHGAPRLGQVVAAARHCLEAEYGLRTLELPLSRVCDAPAFARFTLHLLGNLPDFHTTYNDALREYRHANHVRSHSHPVPELVREGEWWEAPFWIWSDSDPRRRPLFAAFQQHELILSDRESLRFTLPLPGGSVEPGTLAAWLSARFGGIKIRPRALITTMYARLVLGDLFLHGIGGAKYDELTDALISRCFQITPPQFMTVTATMQLAPVNPASTAAELRRIEHDLHELPYHPETFLSDEQRADPAIAALAQEKLAWVQQQLPKGERRERHQAITRLNAQLRQQLEPVATQLEQRREALAAQLDLERLLSSREYWFCTFDETLPQELRQLASFA